MSLIWTYLSPVHSWSSKRTSLPFCISQSEARWISIVTSAAKPLVPHARSTQLYLTFTRVPTTDLIKYFSLTGPSKEPPFRGSSSQLLLLPEMGAIRRVKTKRRTRYTMTHCFLDESLLKKNRAEILIKSTQTSVLPSTYPSTNPPSQQKIFPASANGTVLNAPNGSRASTACNSTHAARITREGTISPLCGRLLLSIFCAAHG